MFEQAKRRAKFFGTCCFLGLAIAGPAQAVTFSIQGVAIEDSHYIDEAELLAVTAPYVKRAITFEDLLRMVNDLQAVFKKAGIVTAEVILPPQSLEDGVLDIKIIEAVIGRVETGELSETKPAFLTRNLSLTLGDLPDYKQLEHDLRVFELSHDIAPTITFGPGDAPGEAVATIDVEEPPRFANTLSYDNFGSDVTGRDRLTLLGRWASVTGWRDTLSYKLQITKDSANGSLGYSRPMNTNGGRLIGSLSYSNAGVTTDPNGGGFVVSETTTAGLSFRQPFKVQPSSAWFVDGGLVAEQAKSKLAGVTFSDVTINEVHASVSYQSQQALLTWGFDLGVKLGDADVLGGSPTEGSYQII